MDGAPGGANESAGATFDVVTIDGDTAVLASFWSAALALELLENEDDGRWIVLGTRSGIRRIGLQAGTHNAGGIHLDLSCALSRFSGEVARLQSIGARLTDTPRTEPYGMIANFADPEGNRFDLCAYTSSTG